MTETRGVQSLSVTTAPGDERSISQQHESSYIVRAIKDYWQAASNEPLEQVQIHALTFLPAIELTRLKKSEAWSKGAWDCEDSTLRQR